MTHKWNQNIAASNKDRIEKLEAELQEVCDGIQRMECEKMQNTEDSLNEIKNLLSRVNQFSEKSTQQHKGKIINISWLTHRRQVEAGNTPIEAH
jgi:predicted nuclease with TOPRIM domain